MGIVSQVLEHVHSSTQHGHWVGNVLSSDGCSSVPGARLKNGVLQGHKLELNQAYILRVQYVVAIVFARDEASAANEAAQHVGHNGAVQVGHHHHVELVGVGHQLHAAVVNDHVIVGHFGVLLGNLL